MRVNWCHSAFLCGIWLALLAYQHQPQVASAQPSSSSSTPAANIPQPRVNQWNPTNGTSYEKSAFGIKGGYTRTHPSYTRRKLIRRLGSSVRGASSAKLPPHAARRSARRGASITRTRFTAPAASSTIAEINCPFREIDGGLALSEPPPSPPPRQTGSGIVRPEVKAAEVIGSPLQIRNTSSQSSSKLPNLKLALLSSYMCNAIVLTLPVALLPTVMAEQTSPGASVASAVAAAASISTLGGAAGKMVNGFVCQRLGGRRSSFLYLLGLGGCIMMLSFAPSATHVGFLMAGMEFFASVQWTSCLLIATNHYFNDPSALATAISMISLGSTAGTLFSKTVGSALLQRFSWRQVSRMGAVVAMAGSCLMRGFVADHPPSASRIGGIANRSSNNSVEAGSILQSIKEVMGSPLFWLIGAAHATGFLARTSDRVLGTFFQDVTNLPASICGGLTASVTLGFVHGLVSSRHFHSLKTVPEKIAMLSRRYFAAIISAIMLALCGNEGMRILVTEPLLIMGIVALASGCMASSLAFQFYQIPNMVAQTFGKNQAVCLSFLDGMGFFLSAPIWAATSTLVNLPALGSHGWSLAWLLLAVLYATGGALMLKSVPPLLETEALV